MKRKATKYVKETGEVEQELTKPNGQIPKKGPCRATVDSCLGKAHRGDQRQAQLEATTLDTPARSGVACWMCDRKPHVPYYPSMATQVAVA